MKISSSPVKRLLWTAVLLLNFQIAAAGNKDEICAMYESTSSISLPCIEVAGQYYRVELSRYDNPLDPDSLIYWKLASSQLGLGTYSELCSSIDANLNIIIPCLNLLGTYWEVELSRYHVDSDPSGLYWTLSQYRKYVAPPSLTSMQGVDTGSIELTWLPWTDGITPAAQVSYNVYLSTSEDFTVKPAGLKTSVTGKTQATIKNLQPGIQYYAKIVAEYGAGKSHPSNELTARTLTGPVVIDESVPWMNAGKAGLGSHKTVDGKTYVYEKQGAELPETGSLLFSENKEGDMTLRRVVSASMSGNTVSVVTSKAFLSDLINQGEVSNSFHLTDLSDRNNSLSQGRAKIPGNRFNAVTRTLSDGSEYRKMTWNDAGLTAEQTNYAQDRSDVTVTPKGRTTRILVNNRTYDQSFSADATLSFQPRILTWAKWSGVVVKELEAAEVSATGTLSLDVLATYNFSATGEIGPKTVKLYEKKWAKAYVIGSVPVYQRVTLSVDMVVSAEAKAELNAQAKANLSKKITVGARYYNGKWQTFIKHKDAKTFSAELFVKGEASGEIRLVPQIEVSFYETATGRISAEPLVSSTLGIQAPVTNNLDYLAAYPSITDQVMLTRFDASLGLESKISVDLDIFGENWEIVPETCLIGSDDECEYPLNEVELFSLPKLEKLTLLPYGDGRYSVVLRASDGTNNPFYSDTVRFEVFPNDATIEATPCVRFGGTSHLCQATLVPAGQDEYTIFVSGNGRLGRLGRQVIEKRLTINPTQPDDDDQCSSDNLDACDDAQSCAAAGGQWDGQACQPQNNQCSSDNLDGCEDSQSCINAGGQWNGQNCQASEDPDPDPDPDQSQCSNLNDCDSEQSCINSGGHWDGSMCISYFPPENYSAWACREFNIWKNGVVPSDCGMHENQADRAACETLNTCVGNVICVDSSLDAFISKNECIQNYMGNN